MTREELQKEIDAQLADLISRTDPDEPRTTIHCASWACELTDHFKQPIVVFPVTSSRPPFGDKISFIAYAVPLPLGRKWYFA